MQSADPHRIIGGGRRLGDPIDSGQGLNINFATIGA